VATVSWNAAHTAGGVWVSQPTVTGKAGVGVGAGVKVAVGVGGFGVRVGVGVGSKVGGAQPVNSKINPRLTVKNRTCSLVVTTILSSISASRKGCPSGSLFFRHFSVQSELVKRYSP
jgi:hypothetical protein